MSGCPYHKKKEDEEANSSSTNQQLHGVDVDQYFIDGETYLVNFQDDTAPCQCVPPAFKFCRMFPDLDPLQPSDSDLITLGMAMIDTGSPSEDSAIPAGYTYLGQFIDHDITRDGTSGLPVQNQDPANVDQLRSPTLDLDSLYGLGPLLSPEQYELDGLHFKIGMTTPSGGSQSTNMSLPNDLPRAGVMLDPQNPLRPLIGDDRNDENLAVAQTHLAFLKFHNKVADSENDFEKTRKIVTQHYQSIVLHDFLPQFIDENVLNTVLAADASDLTFSVDCGTLPCMPVEFSVAAYRFGHTLIRDSYEWNSVFNSMAGALAPGSLDLLFSFTGGGGMFNNPSLPTNWIVDWTRFFDFTNVPNVSNHSNSNVTRKVDPLISSTLHNLPAFSNAPSHERALPVRNLIRGSRLGLASGQSVAQAMGITALTAAELATGPDGQTAASLGFDSATPLWFYLLKEAQIQNNSERLGELGSRLLSEVFVGLIKGSSHSILCEDNWKPCISSVDDSKFSMVDLLAFVGGLDPVGDRTS